MQLLAVLFPKFWLFAEMWTDYIILEAAIMSPYEIMDLLLSAIPIIIDLIQRLRRRRKKRQRRKK